MASREAAHDYLESRERCFQQLACCLQCLAVGRSVLECKAPRADVVTQGEHTATELEGPISGRRSTSSPGASGSTESATARQPRASRKSSNVHAAR
jgi:hypothetical protein